MKSEEPIKFMCPNCGSQEYSRLHDLAHGIPGTHMSGSERYHCDSCGRNIHAEEGKKLGLPFIYE